MKRKAIQLAKQTIVVSLPVKWVKQQGIKKGDEIDVEERGKELSISTNTINKEDKRIELDISNLSDRVIGWVLASKYKEGYDEIYVKYTRSSSLKRVEEVIKNLFIGFVISDHNEKGCILRAVSKDIGEEFEMALRRAFLVAISMGESCLEMIKQKKFQELNNLLPLEHTNTQLTNFCERVLNKYGYKEPEKTTSAYVITWNLETICDEYKYICKYLSNQNSKIAINKEIEYIFEKTNQFLRSYYELFYKFDFKKLDELSEEEKNIGIETEKIYKSKTEKEAVIIGCLMSIIKKTIELSTSVISIRA